MADAQSLLSQYLTPSQSVMQAAPAKQAEVAAASEAKKQQMYQIAAGIMSGEGLQTATGIEKDLRTLNPLEFQLKYGDATGQLFGDQLAALNQYKSDTTGSRSPWQALDDTVNSAATGVVNGLGGIGALGLGVVNKDAGKWAVDELNKFNSYSQSIQSEDLQARRRANAAVNALSYRDNTAQYEADKKLNDNELTAALTRIGRDAVDTGKNILTDPTLTGDVLSNAAGSLVSGGIVSKGLKVIGKAAVNGAVRTGLVAEGGTGLSRLSTLGEATSMPAAIGIQEGAGAYQQTVTDTYEKLKDRTDLTEDEKVQMANRAGLMAAAIQAPVGAATGILTSKFEELPFRVGSLREAVANTAKEGVEEGIQSATGQLAQNYAVQQNGTPQQDLSEGVGEQTALGVIGGIGSAGAIQSPRVLVQNTIDATKFAGLSIMRGARAVGDSIIARGNKVMQENEQASPVSEEAVQQTYKAASETSDAAEAAIRAAIDKATGTTQEKADGNAYVDKLMNTFRFDPTEIPEELPAPIRETLSTATDRLDAIKKMADLINRTDGNISNEDKTMLGYALINLTDPIDELKLSDPKVLDQIPDGDEAHDYINQYASIASQINSSSKVRNARAAIEDFIAQQNANTKVEDITPETSVDAPVIQNAVKTAEVFPEKGNLEVNQHILKQDASGTIKLNPVQRASLQASVAVLQAQRDANERAIATGAKEQDLVSKEITYDNKDTKEASALVHMKRVMEAYRAGNLELAQAYLDDFQKFNKHMQNKVSAFNQNMSDYKGLSDEKSKTTYEALHPTKRVFRTVKPEAGLNVKATSLGSVRFAQRVANEAATVAQIANSLTEIFPTLKVSPVEPVSLVQSLQGKAEDIVQAYRTGDTNVSETTQKQEEVSPEATKQTEEPIKEVPQNVEEPAQNEPVTNENVEPVKQTMDTLYPNLVEHSLFKKIYSLPKTPKSRTLGNPTPLATVIDALSSPQKLSQMAGTEQAHGYNEAVASEYKRFSSLGSNLRSTLDKNLETFLNKKRNGKLIKDLWLSGEMIEGANGTYSASDLGKFPNWQALNIVDQNLKYNPELIESAILAGMQWIIAADQNTSKLSKQDVQEILGDGIPAQTELVTRMNNGFSTEEAIDSLATKIKKYWGVSSNKNVAYSYVEGLPEAVAGELLNALVTAGVMDADTYSVNAEGYILEDNEQGKVKTFKTLITRLQEAFPNQVSEEEFAKNPLFAFPDAIEKAVLIDPETTNYIGTPPKTVAKTQIRNPLVQNTPDDVKALQAEQKTPHMPNVDVIDFYDHMGLDNLQEVFGAGDLTNRVLNKNHQKSLEGKNTSVKSAFLALQKVVSQIALQADGKPLSDIPVYYDYNMNKLGRMQMLGAQNPQTSKLVREAIMPTTSVTDLTDPKALSNYYLALAQALGVKVHTMSRKTAVDTVAKDLAGKYAPLVQTLQEWHSEKKPFTPEQVKFFKDAGVSFAGMHALIDYARYTRTNDRSAYKSYLYVEADGVTNGPVNAMSLMTYGEFTPEWMTNIGKGGLFIGTDGKTMNDHRTVMDGTGDSQDMYSTVGAKLQNNLNQEHSRDLSAITDLMMEFLPKWISIDENGDLKIDRSLPKNPLTITLYGSGAKGIAGNITDELVNAIYERMSTLADAQSDTRPVDIALALFGSEDKFQKFQKNIGTLTGTKFGNINGQDFTFEIEELESMKKKVLDSFVKPLRDAIADTVGAPLMEAVGTLQKATQIQSISMEYAFQQEILKAMESKDTNDFLSQNEMDEIYQRVLKTHPMINTGNQNFLLAKKKDWAIKDKSFGSDFEGKYRTDGSIPAPSDVGVGGTPTMVVGMGDGRAMQALSIAKNYLKKTLKIFDGMHIALDLLDQGAEAANEAVWQSWQGNPLQEVLKAYSTFLKDKSFKDLSEDEKKSLVKTMFDFDEGVTADNVTEQQLADKANEYHEMLDHMSKSVEARHYALSQVNLSVDQMAAIGVPFVHKGPIDLSGKNKAVVLKVLNDLYRTKLKELQDVKPVTDDVSDELSQVGRKHKSGARILSFTAIKNLARTVNATPEQEGVLTDILRSLVTKGYKAVLGTPDQIADYAEATGKDVPYYDESVKGFITPNDKTIYLRSPSYETMLHELIHAASFEKVLAYYEGNLDDVQAKDAVERIEALKDQFVSLGSEIGIYNQDTQEAYRSARAAILSADNPAVALNEFMAWNLSNPDLIRVTSKVKVNTLGSIVSKAVDFIKKLVFGRKHISKPASDMFTNLKFNTNIIMRSQPTVSQIMADTVLFQNTAYGTNQRLTDVDEAFDHLITDHLASQTQDKVIRDDNLKLLVLQTKRMTGVFSRPFNMSMQEKTTFLKIVAALSTQAHIDPTAMLKAQELYTHTIKNLSVESFMADPLDDTQRPLAQQKYNLFVGVNSLKYDDFGRSSLVPMFLGMAIVNDEFRKILSSIPAPKAKNVKGDTVNHVLENVANDVMEKLSDVMSNTHKAKNVEAAIDGLTQQIMDVAQDRQNFADKFDAASSGFTDKLNDYFVDKATEYSGKIVDAAKKVETETTSKSVKAAARFVQLAASLVSEETGKKVAEGVMTGMNNLNVWQPFHDLMNELTGRSDRNASIYDMIKVVRSSVSQLRQQFREHLPTTIAGKFSRKISDAEWTHMYKGLAKTDLVGLLSGFNNEELIQLLQNPDRVNDHIQEIEEKLKAMDAPNWNLLQSKSKQLAAFMNTGSVGSNLLRNANAISNLYRERATNNRKVTKQMINLVDQLVSLYAYESLTNDTKSVLSELAKNETKGVAFTLAYLTGQRAEEVRKTQTNAAKINGYKGYVPTQNKQGRSLIIADDNDYAALAEKSFIRVGDYNGSNLERGSISKGYYYAPVSGKPMFNQGIVQNVRSTASGVDLMSGFTHDMMTGGRITDPKRVAQIDRLSSSLKENTSEPLMPVFDEKGKLVAFERAVDPSQLVQLDQETHLAKMIGVWRGRQVEEGMAQKFNENLLEKLHDVYLEDLKDTTNNRRAEYIDILDPAEWKKDPVLGDAVKLFTPEFKAKIGEVFGDQFFVRKDMLNDVTGYRNPSISDVFTGNSRWTPEQLKLVKTAVIGALGNKAYAHFTNGEKFLQNLVSSARVTIVIKSVVVPVANLVSNIYQLSARGVPLLKTLKSLPKKTVEIDTYVKTKLRQIELEAELRAAEGNLVETRKLRTQIQSIKDSHMRMSIWPLIENGEFSSISDAGISRDEILLTEGKLNEYIETLVDKLPASIRTAGKYAIVAKDTALFQGLQRAVEYGDFLAKAIYYEDLITRKRLSKQEALGRVTEEFINYDRLPGRARTYLDSIGATWFWNFKIRSAKIAVSMIRNNPIHALIATLMPAPELFGSIGLPTEENIFSILFDGRLGFSVGPGQGLRSFGLNPWVNLVH